MASSSHRIGPNFRDTIVKAAGLRLSDVAGREDQSGVDFITGDGAPSGAYGRTGDVLIYIRSNAASANEVIYISRNVGVSWEAVDATLAGADFGSTGLEADVIAESTGGAGVTVDGALIKDGHIVDSVGFYDGAAPTKLARIDVGAVTAGQTRVLSVPDANVDLGLISTALQVGDDRLVQAVVAVANATGGATGAALTVTLTQLDGTAVTSEREVLVLGTMAAYSPWVNEPGVGSVTFGSATVGTIVASGQGYAQIRTDASGAFACTVSNADDETVNFVVHTGKGLSALTYQALVVGCVPDSATWSA